MDNPAPFLNLSYLYQKIYDLLTGSPVPDINAILELILAVLAFISPLSVLLSLLFLTGVIYSTMRIRALLHAMEEQAHGHTTHVAHAPAGAHGAGDTFVHAPSSPAVPSDDAARKRWVKIVEHANSENSSDWRLAILECDIILDEMLTKMSYRGETLADKLKAVEKSDFLTIDKAWEAHRVRNTIAHEGSNFQLTDREARRVVGLYADVFKEFHYI